MSPPPRHVDQAAFDEYTAHDGQEITTSVLVDASVGDAFDAWLQHVWIGYASKELAPGTGRGLVGHTRQVPLGIVEQIVSVGLPRENGSEDSDAIPSIHYKLREYGPMPIRDHTALVRFVPDTASSSSPKTLVLWTIKIMPSTVGNVALCGGLLLRVSLRSALSYFLHRLRSKLKKAKRQ
ncbi:hypothetical protein FI667_g1201, partial [Globisporangium splendens]